MNIPDYRMHHVVCKDCRTVQESIKVPHGVPHGHWISPKELNPTYSIYNYDSISSKTFCETCLMQRAKQENHAN